MSTVKSNALQIGQSVTATNNFTWYQPASPDGTVRLGNGNSGSVSDVITVGTTGNLTLTGTAITLSNSAVISAASTKTLTLNGGGLTNGLVLDASNNVGLGVTPVGAKIEAAGTIRSSGQSVPTSGSGIELIFSGGTGYLVSYNRSTSAFLPSIYQSSTHRWDCSGAASAMYLDSSGNLGLGVTPISGARTPTLQVGSGGTFRTESYSAGNVQAKLLCNAYEASNTVYTFMYSDQATMYRQSTGAHYWYNSNNTNGTAGASWTPTQAMTLDASGRLLVGYTGNSLGGLLQVSDKVQFTKSITINSSSLTTVTTANAGLIMAGDSTNGGTCICVTDSTSGLSIIGQIGTTVFVTTSPTANQIQIINSAGNIQCLGGASRNGAILTVTNIQLR